MLVANCDRELFICFAYVCESFKRRTDVAASDRNHYAERQMIAERVFKRRGWVAIVVYSCVEEEENAVGDSEVREGRTEKGN